MPELPEVQTIVSDLQKISGDQFVDFFSDTPKALRHIAVSNFAKEITNQKIKNVLRLGKIILLQLASEKFVAIHLKMTGQLLLMELGTWNMEQKNKHVHHVFYLKKTGVLAFSDVRKFATISLLTAQDVADIKSNYGVDPIAEPFSSKDLSLLLTKGKNKLLKSVLMDNSLILGIGNIYASEILFEAKILPYRQASSLSKNEIKKLHLSIKKILAKAINLRGTSVSDYRDSRGLKGAFQHKLKVYQKSGQKCQVCDTMIAKMVIGQRSTFYCPNCQH